MGGEFVMPEGEPESSKTPLLVVLCSVACVAFGVLLLFKEQVYVWQLGESHGYGSYHWVLGLILILGGISIWMPPRKLIGVFGGHEVKSRILGGIGILWGSAILVGGFWSGRIQLGGEGGYQAGAVAGVVFAIALIGAGIGAVKRGK